MFSGIYPYIHKIMNINRHALGFSMFFLLTALWWLILAALTSLAADAGIYDYYRAAMIVPEMVRSAAFSIPLALVSGLIIDSQLENNS